MQIQLNSKFNQIELFLNIQIVEQQILGSEFSIKLDVTSW
jgi:hypothetical protein